MRKALVLGLIAAMLLCFASTAEQIEVVPIQTIEVSAVDPTPTPTLRMVATPRPTATPAPTPTPTPTPTPSPSPTLRMVASPRPDASDAATAVPVGGELNVQAAPAAAGGHLMSDSQGEATVSVGGIFSGGSTVLGSDLPRSAVTAIRFASTAVGAPADAWDVSAERNNSVLAWVSEDGALTIAADGGVYASPNCAHLFAGYSSAQRIDFDGCFHTDGVLNMSHMFESCWSLTELDVSGLDTSSVADMSYMFSSCPELSALNLSGITASRAVSMEGMFLMDAKLTSIDLSGFDAGAVSNLRSMFEGCAGLTELDLSGLRLESAADMRFMFADCTALRQVSLGTAPVGSSADTSDMFENCPATLVVNGREVDAQAWSNLASYAELRRWSRGDGVRWLQSRLAEEGFNPGSIDGVFGPDTESALRAWQSAHSYTPTGTPTPAQIWALFDD